MVLKIVKLGISLSYTSCQYVIAMTLILKCNWKYLEEYKRYINDLVTTVMYYSMCSFQSRDTRYSCYLKLN